MTVDQWRHLAIAPFAGSAPPQQPLEVALLQRAIDGQQELEQRGAHAGMSERAAARRLAADASGVFAPPVLGSSIRSCSAAP